MLYQNEEKKLLILILENLWYWYVGVITMSIFVHKYNDHIGQKTSTEHTLCNNDDDDRDDDKDGFLCVMV